IANRMDPHIARMDTVIHLLRLKESPNSLENANLETVMNVNQLSIDLIKYNVNPITISLANLLAVKALYKLKKNKQLVNIRRALFVDNSDCEKIKSLANSESQKFGTG